ncbi:MAG: MBL fold metallo-hydrolase [Chloroflexia bacterium]|nr:MBL fold metallo-hydrolase [Chloroflexia bacterium]
MAGDQIWQPVATAGTATAVDDGTWMIDLGFQERSNVVLAYLLAAGDQLALIESGPTATLPNLLAGITAAGFDPARLTHLLVSHIHLDHSGAAGVLARDNPTLTVFVHPIGAPHLIDPSRLVASATRLYADRMDALWGEVLPVPMAQIAPLADGETIAVAGRVLSAIHTPGHASHHVAYWDPERAALFTGDVGGVRMPGTSYACPPAPPPELDPAAWAISVDRMRALGARHLFLTHGGRFSDVAAHLGQLMPNLAALRALAKTALLAGADHERLTSLIHDGMASHVSDPEALVDLEWATPSYLAASGLTRFLVKGGEVPTPAS